MTWCMIHTSIMLYEMVGGRERAVLLMEWGSLETDMTAGNRPALHQRRIDVLINVAVFVRPVTQRSSVYKTFGTAWGMASGIDYLLLSVYVFFSAPREVFAALYIFGASFRESLSDFQAILHGFQAIPLRNVLL